MNFSLPQNFDFNVMTICLGLYLILLGIAYYLIYHKHHKRNEVQIDELITLVTKFYSLTILSTIFVCLGIYSICMANEVKYDRKEVIFCVATGIIIISFTILNYIYYIKRSLIDYDPNVRAENKKRTIKIGEVLELVFFLIFIFMPLWQIPRFMEIAEKKELVIEVLKSLGICVAAIILLIVQNPIDIKGRIYKLFNRNGKKENKKIYK